ncbi:LysR family transcriptional regulator [Pseudomonas sp. WS 5018]|jgi:DNA-binding transcriptional LysR family regulator|uniref:LysR family transcriptional regulator n=1 Tax=Stutzerimonas stutzeri TaxID=316 RepID=UPI001475AC22|nr:LysR family transcriptional regulator [Stutzerimonas stutzeri]MDH0185838.1 LysR family transcriptional regulator [Stutzerimonas stutzeri]MDH1251004.1 LysR family transcriptional regulator [Stutzerimonas stutzeri]NMY66767.1 LysR family transcriptional regulator [Pseudomonas sp. WS 5018]
MNDLRQLRHFVALAEHGHFARAAEAVHLSQPALSRSIQALENSLDCRLVDRHSRGISLTAHGQLVLEHARRLLAGSRSLHNAVAQLGNLQLGELRLGAGPFPAARLVPRAIGRLTREHPRIRVELSIDDWRSLRLRLLDEHLELFIADIRELQEDPLLAVEPLQPHAGVLFCRPGHPLLAQAPLNASALAQLAFAGTQLPEAVEASLRQFSGREQPLNIRCDNFMVLKALVAQSDVVSLAPWDVIAEDVEHGRLALLPLTQDVPRQQSAYGVVSRAGHSLSPAAQVLLAALREEDRAFRQAAP